MSDPSKPDEPPEEAIGNQGVPERAEGTKGTTKVCMAPGVGKTRSNPGALGEAKTFTYWMALLLVTVGLIFLLFYSSSVWLRTASYNSGLRVLGSAGLIGAAALSVGGVIGFLFGIPKIADNPLIDRPWAANSNLVQISDWLTKMLVGVGLTTLFKIPTWIVRFGHYYEDSVGSASVAIAVLVHFVAAGFLCGYLMTRLVLQQAFAHADNYAVASKQSTEAEEAPKDEISKKDAASGNHTDEGTVDEQPPVKKAPS